jgi:hypothetical protein
MQDGIDFQSGFEEAFQNAIQLLPKIGYFLLILIIGFVLAKLLQKAVTAVLHKVGFDRAVERGGVKKAMSQTKYDASSLLGKIVYYFVLLLALSAAFAVFGQNPVSELLADIIDYLPSIFAAIVIIVLASAIAAAVKELVQGLLGGLSFGNILANVASGLILAVGIFAALNQLELAPLIVTGLFYALLALLIVPAIIAFGVGGIEPAREAIRTMTEKGREKADEAKRQMGGGAQEELEAAPATTRRRAAPATTRRRRPPA